MGQRAEKTLTRRELMAGALPLGVLVLSSGAAAGAAGGNKRLLQAIRDGDAASARRELTSGASPDAHDAEGNTPLILLCTHFGDADTSPRFKSARERLELASVLLRREANPNALNRAGVSPLMCAAASSGAHLDLAQLLLDRGARVNAVDRQGQTALMFACGEFGSLEMVRLLLSRRASTELRDREGKTALWRALASRHDTCVEALRATGARE